MDREKPCGSKRSVVVGLEDLLLDGAHRPKGREVLPGIIRLGIFSVEDKLSAPT